MVLHVTSVRQLAKTAMLPVEITNAFHFLLEHISLVKMLYLIGPDGLVNLSVENFQKIVWMTIVHYSVLPEIEHFMNNPSFS